MKLNLLESEKNKLRFEVIGEGHTFCNVLRKELWNDKEVEVAGYHIEHDMVSEPLFIVESKGNAKNALIDASERLLKRNKEFLDKVKKSL